MTVEVYSNVALYCPSWQHLAYSGIPFHFHRHPLGVRNRLLLAWTRGAINRSLQSNCQKNQEPSTALPSPSPSPSPSPCSTCRSTRFSLSRHRFTWTFLAPRMRVISGIAVSFDGKSSRYLPLPPLLPSRPAAWQPTSVVAGSEENLPVGSGASRSGLGGSDDRGIDAGAVSADWKALPGEALETIALFVSCHTARRLFFSVWWCSEHSFFT